MYYRILGLNIKIYNNRAPYNRVAFECMICCGAFLPLLREQPFDYYGVGKRFF